MAAPPRDSLAIGAAKLRQWFGQSFSGLQCMMGWLGASALFVGLSVWYGGPTAGDAGESVFTTWAFAHGRLACTYPTVGGHHLNYSAHPSALIAPLYPLVSGGAAAALRIGHAVAFPSQGQFGDNCVRAFLTMYRWSTRSDAIVPTTRLSYLVWPVLLAGTVALVRASGRGRSGWEMLSLFIVACTPAVAMCLTQYFHPEDLLAMGLILGAIALFLKERWYWSGALLGLAVCSQQFALLAAAPLWIAAPRRGRIGIAAAAIATTVSIDIPLVIATSGRAFKIILYGSSRVGSNIRSTGGTVLWELDLHGVLLFALARILPLVVFIALAWWVTRRLGIQRIGAVPILSLVAAAMVIRLVFEENLSVTTSWPSP